MKNIKLRFDEIKEQIMDGNKNNEIKSEYAQACVVILRVIFEKIKGDENEKRN